MESTQLVLQRFWRRRKVEMSLFGKASDPPKLPLGLPRLRLANSEAQKAKLADPEAKASFLSKRRATMEAKGALTKLICQDDLLYPQAIAHQVADLTDHRDAVMAIAQRDIIDVNGRILYRRRGLTGGPALLGSVMDGQRLLRACYLQGTNIIGEPLAVLFRTPVIQQCMPWDDSDPLMLDLNTYEKVAPLGEVALRRESIGAFRVSATSWSTRIASAQGEQTRRWQDRYAATHFPAPSRTERIRATLGRHANTSLRRAVYAGLRARGSLNAPSAPDTSSPRGPQ